MGSFARIAFTPSVQSAQEAMGSKRAYDRVRNDGRVDAIGEDERVFLAERDSFYMATVSETGWPYIQHRGGPKGFVRVLDDRTIAFADLRGNRQYISVGNIGEDARAALIFVDYPHRVRLKVLARAKVVTRTSDAALYARVVEANEDVSDEHVERVFVLKVEGLDWNCPQHITPRFTEDEIRELVQPLLEQVSALEKENAELRAKLSGRG
jgi:predicted pyridoxine 5'-phosphate oxidase superfamily flavin-nucleotide-binding protein